MRRAIGLAATLLVAAAALPGAASAHPLGNYTVNRAVVIEVGSTLEVRYLIDMAEIPAFETITANDLDADGALSAEESRPFADEQCEAARENLEVQVDGAPSTVRLREVPRISFPAGAGGLATLRLECRFDIPSDREGTVALRDTTDDPRSGWREVIATAQGNARVTSSDVPSVSESELLTAYPEARLEAPEDVRAASVSYVLADATAPLSASPAPAPAAVSGGARSEPNPLAALVGGELNPLLIALGLALSLGLGALHALSPGHGKTLVAAYVLGAGGSARSALQIGLWVAVSHTAGVFVIGVVTLVASQLLVPEQVVGWLSLGSGVVVTGLGLFLLIRWALERRRGERDHAHDHSGADHGHNHGHNHAHDHGHDPGHGHARVPARLTWRSALALGFAGGAVPSASALIVLLVAISTDRLLYGIVLIAAFGIGMALVLGGLALVVAGIGRVVNRPGALAGRPLVRRVVPLVPAFAGLAVLATGLAFTVTAASQLA